MMIICPLFMAAHLVVPLLLLRRMSRLEKALRGQQSGAGVAPPAD
jgi:hypothetical protein